MSTFNWNEVPADRVSSEYTRKLIFGQNLVVARIEGKAGAMTEKHVHDSEELVIVLEGAWRFFLPTGEETVRANEVLSIPAGVEHSSEMLEDTVALDVCTPARTDWLSGEDRYLHSDFHWAV
jgi:quercetin dioxygenase-like cupin family protein